MTDPITYHAEGVLVDYSGPSVPERVRDVVYFLTLAVAALTALVTGVAAIWLPDLAANIAATGGVATTVMGIVGGGLGVIYRPGAHHAIE